MVVRSAESPDTSLLVTDTEEPVDSQYVEKQQRLLTEPLHSSWTAPDGGPFMVNSNVGLFFADDTSHPLVPDAMLTLGVASGDIRQNDHRSFFAWIVGKVPDVVIEIVSRTTSGEDGEKMEKYERRGIPNYVIYDPDHFLDDEELRAFRLVDGKYRRNWEATFTGLGLGMLLWKGAYEGSRTTWLRWCNLKGTAIPTGRESREIERRAKLRVKRRTELERRRANVERKRADAEGKRAELASRRADEAVSAREAAEEQNRILTAKLRDLGVEL